MTAVAETAVLDWERVARAAMHPTALAILEAIRDAQTDADASCSPSYLAEAVGVSLGTGSYHTRMLVGRGLIVLDHTEPVRGALQHFYRLAPGVVA